LAEVRRILARYPEARPVVALMPFTEWHHPLFQRPHQLALALAGMGCLVFFCEPPWAHGPEGELECVAERLYVGKFVLAALREVASPVLFLLSYNVVDTDQLDRPRVVYELIDELDVFAGDQASIRRNHERLLATAPVVVATADRLWRRIARQRPDALLCPNGVDYAFIRRECEATREPPADLSRVLRPGAPVIGYYGALAQWFDYELVKFAAVMRPDYEFVLIGPRYDSSLAASAIERFANIHWLESRPHNEIPRYLKFFDVATIPFKLGAITHSTSPLKLFEYMAGGKPVVTTAMHESARYPGVLVAEGAMDFVARLDQALALRHDSTYLQTLDRVARENTWEARARQILDAVDAADGVRRPVDEILSAELATAESAPAPDA
jgi:hypothetical protein